MPESGRRYLTTMNRRTLVRSIARLGAIGAASGRIASTPNGPSFGRVAPTGAIESAINEGPIAATVVDRSRTSVTARFRATEPIAPFVPVAVRRRFPDGAPIARAEGPTLGSSTPLDRRVTFEFGGSVFDDLVGPWFYELRRRPVGDPDAVGRYLCESDPIGGGSKLSIASGPDPARPDDDLPVEWPGYERVEREGRYELAFEWADSTGTVWSLETAIGKAGYHRARDRPGAFPRTFFESRTSPYARHLADRIADLRPSGRTGSRPDASDAERAVLDRTVRFVQSFEYQRDRDSTGTFDYHRSIEESLVDGAGDCEDGTYLLAGLLSQPPFEYDLAIAFAPAHAFLGVHRSDLPAGYRDVDPIGDSPYVAIETTDTHPIGRYRGDPIVAVVGDSYRFVDPAAAGPVLERQVELLSSYYWRG